MFPAVLPLVNPRPDRQIVAGFLTAALISDDLNGIHYKNNSCSGYKNDDYNSLISLKSLVASLAVVLAFSLASILPAQAQSSSSAPSTLNISKPNGYATTVANDFNHKTVLGAVRWTRVWDGYEWKFNPHWESLSTSWGNLTGSQSANTTVGDIPVAAGTTLTGVDKPPNNLLISRSTSTTAGSSGGSGGGCWAWVDEDWQPTYTSVMFFDPEDPAVTMEREAGPMLPLRSTPFNRGLQSDVGTGAGAGTGSTDYIAAKSVNIDYATLCPGGGTSSSAVQQLEGIRRSNELYVGTEGRYAFNNRSVLEKRAIKQLATAATATQYANIASGQLAASILANPVANPKGYRWIDKSGDWTDYNTQGQVVAFGDKNNNIIWLLRDTDGLLIAVIDGNTSGNPASAGKVLYSLHYSGQPSSQLLTQVKDYSNSNINPALDQPSRSISYQYDDKNRLTQVTDARGGITTYTYDKRNRIIKITDPENRVEKFGYIGDTTRRRTAPDGGVSDYVFEYDDVNKQFTSKIQGPETAAGRTSEIYTHNRVGKLVGQTLNGRAELHIKYDTGNRSEVRTNARGFGTRLTKNEFEQLVQIDQADGTSSSKSYSAQHLGLTQETDELGIVTQYQYDSKGNLTQKRQAAGTADERITNYIVNSQGQATSITRKGRTETNITGGTATVTPDATWQLEYDSLGHVKKTIDPEGNTRQYSYDRDGNLRKYTDPRGNSTSYEVDAAGNLTKSTDALGRVQTYQYDKVGNLTQVTDARAKVSQAAYDAMNRSTKIVNAVGGQFQVQYNAKGMPILFTDEDGRTTQAESDNYYHFTKVTDGAGNTTQASSQIADGSANGMLGSLNSAVEVNYPTFTLKNRFDQLERPTSQTLVNTSSQAPQATQSLTNTTSYDKRGQIKSETNASGNTYTYTYNALGQRLTTTDTINGTTTFSYDARGNLLQLVDAKGNTHRFEYDRNNRIVKETLPLGQSTRYTYDGAGNLVKKVDPLGNTFTSSFDAANRLTELKQTKAGGTLVRTSTPTWDSNNNLVGWTDTDHTRPTGQQTTAAVSTFDSANRKTTETISYPNPQGNNTTLTYSYQYSPAGKKTQLIWPDGTKIDYSYSAHGELQSTTLAGEGSMSVSQYKWLAPEKLTLPGGHTQAKSYDGLLNLEALKVKTAGQQTVLDLQNSYSKEQELTQSKRTDTAANISTSKTSTYSYDTETRLTQAKTDTGGLFGTDTQTFTLDSLANRTAHSRTSGAWTYDANNRLTQRGTGTCGSGSTTCYQYDDAGNLIQKTESGKVMQYAYDTQNRLVEVADATAGSSATQRKTIAQYGYDPLGRRIWKEQYRDANAMLLAQPKRTIYLYADEGLIAEATQAITVATDASGVQTVTASAAPAITTQYGPTPNSPFGTGALFIKTKNSNNTDTVAYYHHDHLQTPIQATDKAGNIVWAASYDAFGKASIITPAATADKPTIESNLRLPGQYEDQETGLHYNYFRYYDTQTGRYISQDPIGLGGGVNAYAYVDGNPTGLVDPYGLLSMDPVWGGVYGLTGGWSPSENTVNAVAGFGDTMSWGGSAAARKFFDIDGGVNKCSAAYTAGTASAVVFSLAWGGAHFGRHASNVGATKFFVDLRQYPTIQRIWSKTVGGYKGKYELHHWFTPQSAGGTSAGWNMVPVSGWLNRKMSDGGFFFEAFKYSMMGTYGATAGAIPTAITQSQKCECQ